MSKEWITPQECIGLPGFQASIPTVRKRLNALSHGQDHLKRKRIKTKAWEYHLSILPEYVRPYVVDNEALYLQNTLSNSDVEPKEIWEMMFRLLTPAQQKQVTDLFRTKGIEAVFVDLFSHTESPS